MSRRVRVKGAVLIEQIAFGEEPAVKITVCEVDFLDLRMVNVQDGLTRMTSQCGFKKEQRAGNEDALY